MKRNFTLSLACLIFGGYIMLGYFDGPANGGNIAGNGEPGSISTCVTCHGNNQTVNVEVIVLSDDGDTVDMYIPGDQYTAKVLIEAEGWFPQGFGFQMSSLLDDNSDVDGWSDPGANVQISPLAGRTYAEHSSPKATGDFDIKWTAPEVGSGDVTFYVGGNGVNRNNSTSGDGAMLTTLKINEGTSTSTNEEDTPIALTIYPNPTSDFLQVEFGLQEESKVRLLIHDTSGRLVLEKQIQSVGDHVNERIDLQQLLPSNYVMSIQSNNTNTVRHFVKI